MNNDLNFTRMISTSYNISKFLLGKFAYFHTHLFCIDDHVDSMSEVSKKHDQNLKENDYPHKKHKLIFAQEG